MKNIYTFVFVFLLFSISINAQEVNESKYSGRVISSLTGEGLKGILIQVGTKNYRTDTDGNYSFLKSEIKDAKLISFSSEEYNISTLSLEDNMLVKLSPIDQEVGTIVLSMTELDSDEGVSQSTPGLLFSSGDTYSSIAGYSWGPYWFRVRGYQTENTSIYMDGVDMKMPERGYASFSQWGGLNDVTRNKEVTYNIAPVDFGFSKVGGSINMITKASTQSPGLKLSYSLSNSSYSNRVMATYSTGLMDNGWALTASASRRWGQEGYVEGTLYDAYAAFLGIEKKFSENHSLQLTAFVVPYQRGQTAGSVQEAYDLKESSYYNANWGYQDGEKRNARVKKSTIPQFILNHDIKLSGSLRLKTAAAFSFGLEERTALNWYDAADPRPDYYRYLPSYQYNQGNIEAGDLVAEAWKSGQAGQIDWDYLYNVNYNSAETYVDKNETITGNRAHYIIENRSQYSRKFDFNPTLLWEINQNLNLASGIQYLYYNSNSYNSINDLLGADYYVDIDNFADRDFVDPEKASNDLNAYSAIKTKEGDRIGHDYNSIIQTANWWSHAKYTTSDFMLYGGLNLKSTSMHRYGNRKKGLFPDNSYGKSEQLNFIDYGVKFGGEYYLNGRNVITLNNSYYTQAPYFQDAFVSIRTRNEVVENLESANILSSDLNYYFRGQKLNIRATAFYTQMNNITDVISYFDDSHNSFVNYALKGIGKEHYGFELGAQYNFTEEFRIKTAATYASYTYIDNPMATVTVDNSAERLDQEQVYFNGRHLGGSPELAGAVALEYWSKDYWFVTIGANFLANRYVTLNPARYTRRAIETPGIAYFSPEYYAILDQEKLNDAFMLDISGGKSWKIGDYLIRLNVNLSNVLNNTNVVTTGYQQYRFDFREGNPEKFANKYFYGQGFRAFINLSFSL